MSYTMPITEAQKKILQQFTCERLTDSVENLCQIQRFYSKNGEGLVNSLRVNGWASDAEGSTNYYVIKNPRKQIVMFFSLKCGVLFDPEYVIEYMDKCREIFLDEKLVKRWQQFMDGDRDAILFFKQKEREMGDDFDDFVETLRIKTDKINDPNKKIIRVGESHPAIELVEFCTNDRTKDCWATYGMDPRRKLGETMFWWFIVPTMLDINSLIGCEYVYLFAADRTTTGKLSSYYRNRLHFENLTDLGVIKPSYDFNCFFMGNRLRAPDPGKAPWLRNTDEPRTDLAYYREEFFNNFNNVPDEDFI